MTAVTDVMPLAGTIGGGFFIGLLAGYAIKKIIKIAAVIIGLFIAALAFHVIPTIGKDSSHLPEDHAL